MAAVSVNIPPDGSPPPHQPHAQDEWFMSLPRQRPNAPRPIQRFPKELRRNDDEDKECYEPLEISIGPYHREKKHLEPLQNMKALYAWNYIESKGSSFGDLYGKVERVAGDARKCYAPDATLDDMSDLDFTRMMFLDGCFLLQFISDEVDLGRTMTFVVQDLLLLENQLPFTILMELEGPEEYDNLIKKMKKFVKIVWDTPQPEADSSPTPQPIHHLLHFLRAYLLGNQNHNTVRPQPGTHSCWCHCLGNPNDKIGNQRGDVVPWQTFRTVKELNKAGIDFRVSRSHRFSAVRFRSRKMWRAELELPPIFIDDCTKPILLNLVAYEMCCRDMLKEIADVTSYISFLDALIDRAEDVMELRSKGILKNFTGSDQEVAHLFNTITHNFTPNREAYKEVIQQIEDQRKDRIKMWFVKWIGTYFEAPWSFISAVAAAIALVLTFMQTYFAARQSGNSQNCTCIASSIP